MEHAAAAAWKKADRSLWFGCRRFFPVCGKVKQTEEMDIQGMDFLRDVDDEENTSLFLLAMGSVFDTATFEVRITFCSVDAGGDIGSDAGRDVGSDVGSVVGNVGGEAGPASSCSAIRASMLRSFVLKAEGNWCSWVASTPCNTCAPTMRGMMCV